MNKLTKTQFWFEFFLDGISLAAATGLSIFIFRFLFVRILDYSAHDWLMYGATMALSYVFAFLGFHKPLDLKKRNRLREMSSIIINAVMIYLTFAAFNIIAKNSITESRWLYLSSFIMFIVFSMINRYFLKRALTGRFTRSAYASIAGVITVSDLAEGMVEKLLDDWTVRVSGIALVDDLCKDGVFYDSFARREENGSGGGASTSTAVKHADSVLDVPVVATGSDYLNWIRTAPLDEVYINVPYKDGSGVHDMIEELESMGITVHINVPALEKIVDDSNFNNINCKMYAGHPMATFAAAVHNNTLLAVKRFIDIIVGFLGCIVSIPIILITAIPLLIESPGPLFFKQQRVGKNGRFFNIYKLRSMYPNADEMKKELMEQNKMEGLMFKMDNDPRITKVGRFIRKYSIDELPQFFNVVKGDMSLVGTRPPTVDEFEKYESRHKRRLSMRPGITGMWQVSGRSNIQDFEEVVKLDCQYIDNWSLALDIKLLLKTVKVVLKHEGAE
ncbi:MAG: sugar transferase [Eubacterium sp.]